VEGARQRIGELAEQPTPVCLLPAQFPNPLKGLCRLTCRCDKRSGSS
jgi:hypothetical protein